MTTTFADIFSAEDLLYIHRLPEVLAAKDTLNEAGTGKVYFTMDLTASIRAALQERFGLDLSSKSSVPMRWIKGDTAPHIDRGASPFERTYLVYLDDAPGQFIVGGESFPIAANTGFVFPEGVSHTTQGTGDAARLLLGPMSELAEPVGTTIYYYDNYADAFATNGNTIAGQGLTWILGDTPNIVGSIGSYTSWRVAATDSVTPPPSGVYNNGFDLYTLGYGGVGFYVYPATPCFLEGSTVLCLVDGARTYVPVEKLSKGMLVKTSRDGYKKVVLVGKGVIQNPADDARTEHRLYRCSVANYPELTEDLYITGAHSILVDSLTDEQRAATVKQLGKVFVTEGKYRLPAQIDERAAPWASEGAYTIYHFALDHADDGMNYGVYANGGLLVETCSIRFLKGKANMTLV